MKRKSILSSAAILAAPVISILLNVQAHAASFTYGNIAILREGDGVSPLSTTSAPIAVLEITPAGSVVQTINVPTTGANRLVQSSSSASEGFITRSIDTNNLTFVGYDAPVGITNIPASGANGTNRCWGQVDLNGNYTRGASGSSAAFTGISPFLASANVRSSTSDGSNYWMSGTSAMNTDEGIWYSSLGGPWIQIVTTAVNSRVTRIFNGKLYYDTSTTLSGFTGLPKTATAATATGIMGSSIYDFAINPAGNVAYVCDDTSAATAISKWTNNGTVWAKAFTFNATNGFTAGGRGLAVDFTGLNPVIYATTADSVPKVIEITDTSAFSAGSDTNDQLIVLATSGTYAIRGVALAPAVPTSGPATITGVSPAILTNYASISSTFAVTANGTPPFNYQWYSTNGNAALANQTNEFLTFANPSTGNSGFYYAVVSNSFSPPVTSSIVQLVIVPGNPNTLSVSPLSTNVSAGSTVTFTATVAGSPPFSYQWYNQTNGGVATNLLAGQTNATLTLSNLLNGNTGGYYVVVTNIFQPPATSSVATLTVTGDPHISAEPSSTYALLGGQVQFTVAANGTAPFAYQWYFADNSGNMQAPVSNGSGKLPSGQAVVSGATTATLTISNLQYADLTNFIVVVTNIYGSLTSSVPASPSSPAVSILGVQQSGAILAFWDFNGPEFTNNVMNPNCLAQPVPYLGAGAAFTVGLDNGPFTATTTADPNDGLGFQLIPGVDHFPNFSWGTGNPGYPVSGSNKLAGIQFNVSTVGAKNIILSYDSRTSPTASNYERVQYTTNGTDWIDYPSSASFNGVAGTGAGGWETFTNYEPPVFGNANFTGFPNVANNPNFGIRIVTEFQSTATYGVSTVTNYVGVANAYGGNTGTITYDLVGIYGDAITNGNIPPSVNFTTLPFSPSQSAINTTNTLDTAPITLPFTVSGDANPATFTYTAVSLNQATVHPSFVFTNNSSGNDSLTIIPNPISQSMVAAPILVTVTDAHGDSTATWFYLTLTTTHLPPTNTLTQITGTNTLANKALSIPFMVGSQSNAVSQLTYSASSGNQTVIPNANIAVTGQGTANPTLTILPGSNQLGVAVVNVTVFDNNSEAPKSTTASIPIMVRPNTNVNAVDYFNYDTAGALDIVSGGFWQHLSGIFHQMQVGGGVVTVDTLNNSENVQTPLLGAPYTTNYLYYSFVVNMNPNNMPLINGTYFAAFNDGQNITADVNDLLVAATNGAALGYFRLGIANDVGATAATLDTIMFPQDLTPGVNYVVVTRLNVATGESALWVAPSDQSSPNVVALVDENTIVYPIADFQFRESGGTGGAINVSYLKVGTTFDSVFPSLNVTPSGTNVIVNWSDPTLGIQETTNLVTTPFTDIPSAQPPYTNNATTNSVMFFRFGR
ncbi:MAG TPA: immunoglobulin domain-containing protein [Pseudomonadales bacterium]|nr:immunoglobulin domain-containing protein [Pseudomonadales bacterium]